MFTSTNPFAPTLPINLLGAPASRRPVRSQKLELAGETPALPGTVPRFRGSMREILFRGILSPFGGERELFSFGADIKMHPASGSGGCSPPALRPVESRTPASFSAA